MSLRRRGVGILLEVVAETWTFKNPVLWNRNGTCKMYILIIDHVHKIDLYTPPSKPLRPFSDCSLLGSDGRERWRRLVSRRVHGYGCSPIIDLKFQACESWSGGMCFIGWWGEVFACYICYLGWCLKQRPFQFPNVRHRIPTSVTEGIWLGHCRYFHAWPKPQSATMIRCIEAGVRWNWSTCQWNWWKW